jgi:transposase
MNRRLLVNPFYENIPISTPPIHLKTLLNKVHRIKSFVYHSVSLSGSGDSMGIVAKLIRRTNIKPRCFGCGKPRPGNDRMCQTGEFKLIPIWNISVALSYTMRRVDYPACGIKVEAVPWAQGKYASCDVCRHFLASWTRRMS